MAYDLNKLAKLQAVKDLAERTQTRLAALENGGTAIKSVVLDSNTLKFYNTTDTATATATYSIDLPAEMFLDQASTSFVPNFTFSAATYPNATDPNLNGKPVMVLGVKTKSNDGKTESISYSFIDVSVLVDTYTASDTSIVVSGYKVKVNVSETEGNMLANTANGLYVDGSGKADKVTGAVEDNFAALTNTGNLKDSGYSVATNAEVTEMLDSILGTNG